MRKILTCLLLISIVVIGASCERRPLYEQDANVHITFDFDTDMPNVEAMPLPELMKVSFLRTSGGALAHSCYLKPEGGYAKVDYATYDLSSYNFDTDFTQVRDDHDLTLAEAYVTPLQADPLSDYNRLFRIIQEYRIRAGETSRAADDYTEQILVNQPDHLYTGLLTGQSVISRDGDAATEIVIPVSSVAKTYRLDISTITGMEYLSSADAFITGQAMSVRLHSRVVTGDPCSIHVGLLGGKSRSADLSSLFNTFDRHPSARAYVVLQLIDYGGNMQVYEWDVTDQFDDATNPERVIRVSASITIDPPPAESLQPVVNLWDETNFDINL